MAKPLAEQGGIARAFAEFALLPDMMFLAREPRVLPLIPLWAECLKGRGCSLDHVEENDRPNDSPLWGWMAEDALNLSLRLGLLWKTPGGDFDVATAGEEVASMADTPMNERGEAGDRALRSLLARQVRALYRGSGGIEVPKLLLEAARAMQGTEHVWAKHCPGLLLVEFDALVHEAENDREEAKRLLGELETNRGLAMHPYGRPGPASDPNGNAILHADAVTNFYLFNLEYDARSSLTITGARASAMLFTFAGLLAEGGPLGPVQMLAPPPDAARGGA